MEIKIVKTKIIKVPYRKEEGLKAIKECWDLIEGFEMIHSIKSTNKPVKLFTVSFVFCNSHPRDWAESLNSFLSSYLDIKEFAVKSAINTLNELTLEVMNHDS